MTALTQAKRLSQQPQEYPMPEEPPSASFASLPYEISSFTSFVVQEMPATMRLPRSAQMIEMEWKSVNPVQTQEPTSACCGAGYLNPKLASAINPEDTPALRSNSNDTTPRREWDRLSLLRVRGKSTRSPAYTHGLHSGKDMLEPSFDPVKRRRFFCSHCFIAIAYGLAKLAQ
jgi:hypothetical protein